jgi:hypothetical protein
LNAKQDNLTFGIANNDVVKIDSTSVADDKYARFTADGLESLTSAEVKIDLGLNDVENTTLSTWAGTTNITALGTIASGTWNASTISSDKIASGITSGDVIKASSTATNGQFAKFTSTGLESTTLAKGDVSLGNVENTALSTWAGTSNITTLGTIATGAWEGTAIADSHIASASTWNDAVTDLDSLETKVGSAALDTTATNVVAAVNELHGEINSNDTDIGSLVALADAHELAIGLEDNGTYLALSSANYATDGVLKTAVSSLDTQVKTNADDIDLLEIRDGGLFEQVVGSVYYPSKIKISGHLGPFRIDLDQIITNSGCGHIIFFGTSSKRHEDRHFKVLKDGSDYHTIFTGTTL